MREELIRRNYPQTASRTWQGGVDRELPLKPEAVDDVASAGAGCGRRRICFLTL